MADDWMHAYQLMKQAGLLHMLRPPAFVRFSAQPSVEERDSLERLAAVTHWRARCHNARAAPLITVLNRVLQFRARFPSLELWRRPRHGADWETAARNERLFAYLQEFMRDTPQRGTKPLLANTVSNYISTLRAALSLEAEQNLLLPSTHVLQSAAARHMQRDDGEAGHRRLRMGFRLYHQRGILARRQLTPPAPSPFSVSAPPPGQEIDLHSPYGMWAWDTAIRTRVTLRRGGECGHADGLGWNPQGAEGSRWMHVRFFPQGHPLTGPAPFLIDNIRPLKKADSRRYPLLVSAKPLLAGGWADPLCPFAAYVRQWLLAPAHSAGDKPMPADFARAVAGLDRATNARLETQHMRSAIRSECAFTMPNGLAPSTSDILDMFRHLARAAGLDAVSIGSNAGRIGGAEDIYDSCLCQGATRDLAQEQGMRLIKERGRWDGDIAWIYARPSATAHLLLSSQMGEGARVDIETLLSSVSSAEDHPAFAQPAWY